MPIDRSVIAEILAKTDLVTLIGGHVALRRQGQHFTGLCPFHSERTPSFHVRPDRGFFKCFGCGVGGDAIRFVERMENLPFPEAARLLAKRAGVAIEEETEYTNKMRGVRQAIYAANVIAATFFHRALLESPEAEAARAYCARRGLDAATIERFNLGYAPKSWDALAKTLRAAGVDEMTALQAGLLKEGQHGYYDFYRDRLMIPTQSMTGEIVAFGGRALGDDEPKYLNTTNTPVYNKGHMLFGLNHARRAAGIKGNLIIVEGYLDCIALHQFGFDQTIASLGTAFTREQADLVRRYVKNVYVALDADKAGRGAADKSHEVLADALGTFERSDCRIRVVQLPEGEDPDAFVRANGTDAFARLLEEAPSLSNVRVDRALAAHDDGFTSRTDLVEIAEQIIRLEPQLEQDRLRVYVASKLGVSVEEMRRSHFHHFADRTRPRLDALAQRRTQAQPLPPTRDYEILSLFVEEPALIAEYRDRIAPYRIVDPHYRRLYERLLSQERMESGVDVLVAVSEDPEAGETLFSLSGAERSSAIRFRDGGARREQLDRIVATFARENEERRLREIEAEIDGFLEIGTPVPAKLIEEQRELASRLRSVSRGR